MAVLWNVRRSVVKKAATLLSWAFQSPVCKLHLLECPPCGLEGSLAAGISLLTRLPRPQPGDSLGSMGTSWVPPPLGTKVGGGREATQMPLPVLDLGKPLAPWFLYLLLGMTSAPQA